MQISIAEAQGDYIDQAEKQRDNAFMRRPHEPWRQGRCTKRLAGEYSATRAIPVSLTCELWAVLLVTLQFIIK